MRTRTRAIELCRRHRGLQGLGSPHAKMSALFNFQSALLVLLLLICTSAYAHQLFPGIMDRNKDGAFTGLFWKCARIGERLSPYISVCCIVMAVTLFTGP